MSSKARQVPYRSFKKNNIHANKRSNARIKNTALNNDDMSTARLWSQIKRLKKCAEVSVKDWMSVSSTNATLVVVIALE